MKTTTNRKSKKKSNNKTNNNNQYICPKCRTHFTPKYSTLEQAKDVYHQSKNQLWVIQHVCGICGDECMNSCTNEKLAQYLALKEECDDLKMQGITILYDFGEYYDRDSGKTYRALYCILKNSMPFIFNFSHTIKT